MNLWAACSVGNLTKSSNFVLWSLLQQVLGLELPLNPVAAIDMNHSQKPVLGLRYQVWAPEPAELSLLVAGHASAAKLVHAVGAVPGVGDALTGLVDEVVLVAVDVNELAGAVEAVGAAVFAGAVVLVVGQ